MVDSSKLNQVIEELPISQARKETEFVPIDKLYSPRDIRSAESNSDRDVKSNLGMTVDDLKLLGFQMIEPEDVAAQQRESKVQVTYTEVDQSSMSRTGTKFENSQLTKRSIALSHEDSGSDRDQSKLDSKRKNVVSLVFLPEATLESKVDQMQQSYKRRKQLQRKAVKVQLTQDEIQLVQLNKIYELVTNVQRVRVKDMMSLAVLKQVEQGDSTRMKTLPSKIETQRISQQTQFELTDKQVDMFFNNWGGELNELPLSFRHDVMRLGRPKNFKMHEKVIDFDEGDQNMYLVVDGSALLFQNQYSYDKFQQQLETVSVQQKEKAILTKNANFSNIVHIGTLLLKFVHKDPLIQHIIQRGKRRIQAKKIEDAITQGEVGFSKLSPGNTFGDFSEVKSRAYKSQCVVAMSETFKTIMISNKDLRARFAQILTPENIKLIRGRISPDALSHNVMKRVSRCFNQREFPPGKIILHEGEPLKSIYILKRGSCEVYSHKNPLKARGPTDESFFLKVPVTGEELCLGLNEGSMSKAFNYFPISEVGPGTWIGEEAFFLDVNEVSYTVKCRSTVTVLEIGLDDFESKMPHEMMSELKEMALQKQFFKLVRMREIAKTATDLKTREALHKFQSLSLKTLIRLHPHASKRIMTQMGHNFQMEGSIRTARYKDATKIGQIQEVEASSISSHQHNSSQLRQQSELNGEFEINDGKLTSLSLRSPSPPLLNQTSPPRVDSQLQVAKEPTFEKFTKVQALSPSGKHIDREIENRRIILDRKQEAVEEHLAGKLPNHFKGIHVSSASMAEQLDKERAGNRTQALSIQTKQQLLGLGVNQNNPLMLSLTTVNGAPISQESPNKGQEEKADEDLLVFEPTEAQIQAIKHMVNNKRRHPIMEMRAQAEKKSNSISKSPLQKEKDGSKSKEVIRSITFFNTQHDRKVREKRDEERKQVFKLSASVERLVTLQPSAADQTHLSQSIFKNNSIRWLQQASSKQLLKDGQYIPSSAQRVSMMQLGNTFAKQEGSSIHSLNQGINNSANRHTSQLFKTYKGGDRGRNSPDTRKMTLRQSYLYHAQRVSSKDVESSAQMKRAMKHQSLHRSLQFTSGGLSLKQELQGSLPQLKPAGINQNSSVFALRPDALFEEHPLNQSLPLAEAAAHELANMNHSPHASRGHKRDWSVPSPGGSSHVFGLDLSRISKNNESKLTTAQMLHPTDTLDDSTVALELQQQRRAFEFQIEQQRAESQLEIEMLKDIKKYDPENDDRRLQLVEVDNKNETAAFGMAQAKQERFNGDSRYLEPKIKPAPEATNGFDSEHILAQQTLLAPHETNYEAETLLASEALASEALASGQAFRDYVEQGENPKPETCTFDADKQSRAGHNLSTLPIDAVTQVGEIQLSQDQARNENEAQDSSSHASVLEAIERTVSLYSAKGRDSQKTRQTKTSSVAVLNEMLSNRNKTRFQSGQEPPTVKAFKTGTFKFKNLTSLETHPVYLSTAGKMISPREISPKIGVKQYKSLKNSTVFPTNPSILGSSKIVDQSIDGLQDSQRDSEAAQYFSQNLDKGSQRDAMHISQVNIAHKPSKMPFKKGRTQVRVREKSNESQLAQSSIKRQQRPKALKISNSPRTILKKESAEHNMIETPREQARVSHLAAKLSQKSSGRKVGPYSGRNSPSSPSYRQRSSDLDVVMDSSEINFKKKKVFGASQRSQERYVKKPALPTAYKNAQVSLPKIFTVDVNSKMRNTLQVAEGGQLFPKIVFEEDYKRIQGTANPEREQSKPPESSGTKYYVHSSNHHGSGVLVQGQADQITESNEGNAQTHLMGVTFSRQGDFVEDSRNPNEPLPWNSTIDDDLEVGVTQLPPVHTQADQQTQDLPTLLNEASKADKPKQLAMRKVSKIKIAIERKNSQTEDAHAEVKEPTSASRYLDQKLNLKKPESPNKQVVHSKLFNKKVKYVESSFSPVNRAPINVALQQASTRRQKHLNTTTRVSPRSPREKDQSGPQRNNKRRYEQAKKASMLVQASDGRHEEDMRKSELSLINKGLASGLEGSRVHSQLTDMARQRANLVQSQNMEQHNISVLSQESLTAPVTHKEYQSPRLKHMPVGLFKNVKERESLRIPPLEKLVDKFSTLGPQGDRLGLAFVQQQQTGSGQPSPRTSIFAQHKGVPGKESGYIKQQQRKQESKRIMQGARYSSKQDDNHSSVHGHSSKLRRSLILHESASPNKLLNEGTTQLAEEAFNQRLNQPLRHYVGQNQSTMTQDSLAPQLSHYGSAALRVSEQGSLRNSNASRSHPSEQTRLRFQQIKEEKRRMQQM